MKLKHFIEEFYPEIFDGGNETFTTSICCHSKFFNEQHNLIELLIWPPNLFLITFNLLEFTDKYRMWVSPKENSQWTRSEITETQEVSQEWDSLLGKLLEDRIKQENKTHSIQTLLEKRLKFVFSHVNLNECIYDLFQRKEFIDSVFILNSAADLLFKDCNVSATSKSNIEKIIKLKTTESNHDSSNAINNDTVLFSSLSDSHTKTGFVTLKNCVPQNGLRIHNISHNLTYIKPSVKPVVVYSGAQKHHVNQYNILVLPWPLVIDASAFKPMSSKASIDMDRDFGLFDYNPDNSIDIDLYLKALISAIENTGRIDLIVFPECSMSVEDFNKIKNITFECFGKNAPNLLSGVYGKDSDYSINKASLAFIDDLNRYYTLDQKKHHRWYLDQNQLRTYNLSSNLNPNKIWWENIGVERRHLLILHTKNNVNLCPLICEDLARQEPVAPVVRALGPNLVVSLLLDGPQLRFRWPGKYSAVLSDDPGSSVLSVTPLGMTNRSTGTGKKAISVVALWSDQNNNAEELTLDSNGIGIIIETEIISKEMWTIDGRKQEKNILIKKTHRSILEHCDSLTELNSTNRCSLIKKLQNMNNTWEEL